MEKYTALKQVYLQLLDTMSHLLEKAESYKDDRHISDEDLLNEAIIHDMFDFKKQIQVGTDDMRYNLRSLAGLPHIPFEDNEQTISELKERVAKTKSIISEIDDNLFAQADDRKIYFKWLGGGYIFGKDLIKEFAFQNSTFHVVTAYNILRKIGAPIGKSDYIRLTVNRD